MLLKQRVLRLPGERLSDINMCVRVGWQCGGDMETRQNMALRRCNCDSAVIAR